MRVQSLWIKNPATQLHVRPSITDTSPLVSACSGSSSIASRWTDRAKAEMRRSRLETTARLVEASDLWEQFEFTADSGG